MVRRSVDIVSKFDLVVVIYAFGVVSLMMLLKPWLLLLS